ncbi:DUF1707 SHOCT-like domain-containing protein [Saccharopolyspora griseoalba]|uniref:DUF1707 domain-containing protein n=1 Tax=Saccharopolyspora griseoalba TaxID=1431848 RepID=A0ABW2LII6_9PSEU
MDSGRRGRNLRIGDPEREQAMKLLGEHFSAGRLEIHEYDERCQQIAQARFGSQLDALFDDLPEPRPRTGEPAPVASARPPAVAGKAVLAVGAVVLLVFLVVVARQFGLILLLPLVAVFLFTRYRR